MRPNTSILYRWLAGIESDIVLNKVLSSRLIANSTCEIVYIECVSGVKMIHM